MPETAGFSLPFYRSVTFKFTLVALGAALPLVIAAFPIHIYGWPFMTQEGKVYTLAAGALAWFIEMGALTYLYRQWVAEAKALARGAEIVSLSNLSHEIDVYSGDELEQTARSLQTVGRMAQEAFARLEAMIEVEIDDLKREKNGLSHVLDTVGSGVLVTNRDGLIILCNRRADLWLDADGSIIGHSIFAYLDREILSDAMERIRPGAPAAARQVPIAVEGEKNLKALVAPYIEAGVHHGYVFTLWATAEAANRVAGAAANLASRPEYFDFDLITAPTPDNTTLLALELDKALIIAFDTETTGLHPSAGDRIVSIGAVRMRNGKIREAENYETLIDPEMSIPSSSTQFHQITNDMVEGAPKLEEALPQLLRFCEGGALLGHNVAFDLKFINLCLEREGKEPVAFPVLDTLLLSYVLHSHYEDHNLKSLAERLGVRVTGLHTALGDALMTAEVFLRLVPLLKSAGVETVGEAIQFSRKAYGIRREQEKF